jgi:8-oxo-dGTP pyrophosphatase MutT (NUDIX family)
VPDKIANPWTVLLTRPIYENPWIRVVEHEVLTPSGHPGIYGVVHMKGIATAVVALDEEGRIVLVGQYRFPLKANTWEIPKGGAHADETPMEAIQRELTEETGLIARDWLHIQTMHLSDSVSDESSESFLAWNLEEGIAEPDETEDLKVRRVPFAEAYEMAMSGAITDSISVAAILKTRLLALDNQLPKAVRKLVLGGK